MDPKPKVYGKQLFHHGFVYYKVNIVKGRWYWKCAKFGECSARAITYPEGEEVEDYETVIPSRDRFGTKS
jgi:hypothetical protein